MLRPFLLKNSQSGPSRLVLSLSSFRFMVTWVNLIGQLPRLTFFGLRVLHTYNLGFEQALRLWRPLLANNGIVVVSELSWFTDKVPEPAIAYWQKVYPMMGTEAENISRANRAGFSVLSTHRLPSSAWWINYYNPLRDRMKQIEITPVSQLVIRETEEEMAVFEKFSNFYGYTFYVLRAM